MRMFKQRVYKSLSKTSCCRLKKRIPTCFYLLKYIEFPSVSAITMVSPGKSLGALQRTTIEAVLLHIVALK